jgi:hypothetical protein
MVLQQKNYSNSLNKPPHMKRALTTCFYFLTALTAIAQVTPQVLASSGYYYTSPQLEVSYTVGEMSAVTTVGTLAATHVTQGFHQPEEVVILTALNEQKSDEVNFTVYPNPTAQTIWLGYKMSEAGKVNVAIYDLGGKLIENLNTGDYTTGSSISHFDVSRLAAGNYMLSLQFTPTAGATSVSTKPFSVNH